MQESWGRYPTLLGALCAALLAAALAPAAAAADRPPDTVVEHVEVESHDGTLLRGHVVRPAGRERVPVVLWSTPYAGSLDPEVHDSTTEGGRAPVVPVDLLLENGYAVAQFHVRGTGESGGCFELVGKGEQQDQRVLVDWLADREWSSGKVGMLGQSYDAITALAAAVAAPEALRTVVVSGVLTDLYISAFSPQGAVMEDQFWAGLPAYAAVAGAPPRPTQRDDPAAPYGHHLEGLAAPRYCPAALDALTRTSVDTFAADRQARFFEERRLLPRLGSVRAAVLLWHGFQEHLAFEEDRVWEALTAAPKRQWQGQWAHTSDPMHNHREDLLLPWLDHWLKDGPAPAGLGGVDYEVGHGGALNTAGAYDPGADDPPGDWRRSSAWPPAEAVETTLRLRRDGLGAHPDRTGSRAFRALPDAAKRHPTVDARTVGRPVGYAPPCPGADGPTALVYESQPVETGTTIAGNPRARLVLESDRPAGSFSLQLFALGPDYDCAAGRTSDYRYLTEGGVDLRFVDEGWGDPWYDRDRYTARPFPTGTPVHVRVDLQSLAEHLPRGWRLAAVLSPGPQHARTVQGVTERSFPRLTVHGTSRLDLPLVEGAFPG